MSLHLFESVSNLIRLYFHDCPSVSMETEIRSLGIFCWKKKKEKSIIGEEDTTVPPFLHGNSFTLKTPLTPTFRDFLLWILFFFIEFKPVLYFFE